MDINEEIPYELTNENIKIPFIISIRINDFDNDINKGCLTERKKSEESSFEEKSKRDYDPTDNNILLSSNYLSDFLMEVEISLILLVISKSASVF